MTKIEVLRARVVWTLLTRGFTVEPRAPHQLYARRLRHPLRVTISACATPGAVMRTVRDLARDAEPSRFDILIVATPAIARAVAAGALARHGVVVVPISDGFAGIARINGSGMQHAVRTARRARKLRRSDATLRVSAAS